MCFGKGGASGAVDQGLLHRSGDSEDLIICAVAWPKARLEEGE